MSESYDPRTVLRTVPEVAERLRRHPVSVYNDLRDGKIPCVRIGRAVRVTEAALAEYINQHTQPTGSTIVETENQEIKSAR